MESINWKYCQYNSDLVLASGIKVILSSPVINSLGEIDNIYGNYLISQGGLYYYIGEAKELRKRIKQQYTEKTSTFFKNYLKSKKPYDLEKISILEFELQILSTNIGRKEIEEFGMVNLPTKLNTFERGKRNISDVIGQDKIWQEVQNNFEEILLDGENEMLAKEFLIWNNGNPKSNAGIYMVRNGKRELIYIGESSDIQERYSTHSTTTYFSALRRHIGTDILDFKFIDDKKRRFSETNDLRVTQYLKKCEYSCMAVNFGRYELEEYLIRKYKPILNRKEKK